MSLTEDCCEPAPPAVDSSVGKEEVFGGTLLSYVTGLWSASEAVLFISDAIGIRGPLYRRLADKVARAGYFVVVPDFFQGDAYVPQYDGPNMLLVEWEARHPPAGGVQLIKKVVEELREKGISRLGVAGFCWGAKVAALIGKDDTFKAIVQCHPSFPEAVDYEEVKPPIAVLASPTDKAETLAGPILAARTDVISFVKVFPRVRHGWTCRHDEKNPDDVANANEAHNDLLDWYAKHLPVTTTTRTKATAVPETNSV